MCDGSAAGDLDPARWCSHGHAGAGRTHCYTGAGGNSHTGRGKPDATGGNSHAGRGKSDATTSNGHTGAGKPDGIPGTNVFNLLQDLHHRQGLWR